MPNNLLTPSLLTPNLFTPTIADLMQWPLLNDRCHNAQVIGWVVNQVPYKDNQLLLLLHFLPSPSVSHSPSLPPCSLWRFKLHKTLWQLLSLASYVKWYLVDLKSLSLLRLPENPAVNWVNEVAPRSRSSSSISSTTSGWSASVASRATRY